MVGVRVPAKLCDAPLIDNVHRSCLALLTTVMIWTIFGLRAYRHENMKTPLRAAYLLLALLTVVTITLAGHLGGQFVYGN